jgi:hypothetical protein
MKTEEENINNKNNNNSLRLNYDYHSYENIISNPNPKTIDSLIRKKEYTKTLNKNLLNQKDIKRNSMTEMPSNKNTEFNINQKYKEYKDLNYENNNIESINFDKKYIKTTRNNIKQAKISLKEKDLKKNLKQKQSVENKLKLNDLIISSNFLNLQNNSKKRKRSEENKELENLELFLKKNKKNKKNKRIQNSNTLLNDLHERYLLTNEDLDYDEEKDIKYVKKDVKKLRSYKSNPQLNAHIESTIFNNSEEKIDANNKKSTNFIIQSKFDTLYNEHFILKTKYEILKNNMNILTKKLKQKNFDISQMKKVLSSNTQQINFLSALKDSNLKTLRDNEDLIINLKSTISNLNSKLIEFKNKQSLLENNNNNLLKKENESLKIFLNERDKTITTLKNSLSFLTQNLDNILNISNNNEKHEEIINECEEKIKTLKEQMNQKLIEFNIEKNQNLEEKFQKIRKENENINKILEEKKLEIEKYEKNIKELKENINSKNLEIIEIKNDYEKIKKNLEEKQKQYEEKNIKFNELTNILEKKNNEINDLQKLLDAKNDEIKKRNNNFSLLITKQYSFAFLYQNKKKDIDIKYEKNYSGQNKFSKINDNNFRIQSNKLISENSIEKYDTNNKFIIKKIKNSNLDLRNKNHLNKDLLFNDKNTSDNKLRIKTNFDYFDNYNNHSNEPEKTMKSIYNVNDKKHKSYKNFNTIIGNNLFLDKSTNVNINKDSYKNKNNKPKLYLYNENDEDIKKINLTKPENKQIKHPSRLILSTSTLSVSQNENIRSITYPEKSIFNNEYIYSLINSDIISFNLKQKKFEIIKINDNTKGTFTSYISYYRQNKLKPLLLNTRKYFYILMQKYIFYFKSSSNNINILTKTFSSHLNGKFIQIENNLYLISGNNNTQCELYSLIMQQNKVLPSTNIPRINSGICNVNNEFIYLFFGQFCENSIERLNIKNLNFDKKWEIIKIKEINCNNNMNVIYLEKFITFLDDYNNIIIFGGEDYNNEKCNKNIFGFNLEDNSFSTIGKIDSSALYLNQYIKLDESIFSVFDENNGLHFFSKELDYHEIFNLNL